MNKKKVFAVEYTTEHSEEEYENKRDDAEMDNFHEMLRKIREIIGREPETEIINMSDGFGEWEWNGLTNYHGERIWLFHNTTYFLLTDEEAKKLEEQGLQTKLMEGVDDE